jgi:pilus assembly protein FimV
MLTARIASRYGLAGATALLLLAATTAEALTLGRARGAVILGRPLNIAVPATLDPSEPELCAQADLFQGDVRSGPLEVVIERAETAHLIRLRSTVLIEEPMITVYLRAGCGQQFTRSYVLLADQPQEMLNAPLALAPSVALALPAPAAVPAEPRREPLAPAPTTAADKPLPLRPAQAIAPQPAPARTTAKAKPKAAAEPKAAAKPKPKTAPAPTQPRLKLEPLDVAVESAPPLKLAPQLTVSDTGAGRTAAAAQWKVLSASPEQLAAQARRAEVMEAELKGLREAMQKNTASMTLLAAELENVRSERNIASSALAALAGLLAIGMGLLLWLRWRDTAREHARWQAAVAQESMMDESRMPPPFRPSMDSQVIPDSINSDWIGMSRMDADEIEPTERAPLASRAVSRPVALGPLPEFAQSEFTAHRAQPGAEELIDIKQKADFFIALGQIGQAVDLLEAQIHDHLGSSPLVWLDLLDICQRFDRRDEYERFRAEFQVAFNARLPEFDAGRRVSGGLEDHPRALSRICLLWPSPRVLQVIEESLFGNPHEPSAITFDLEASRDLLLLYGIAKEVVKQEAPVQPRQSADELPSEAGGLATEPVPLAALDGESLEEPAELAPDIDLDFLHRTKTAETAAPAPTAAPEIEAYDFDFEPKARHRGLA